VKDDIIREVIPLYSRVASSLRSKIFSGQYEPGRRLPSEEGLAEYYRVSRITIRESLAHLEREGLINRHRGKGTFVSEDIPKKKHTVYTSLLDIVNTTRKSEIKPLEIRTMKVQDTTSTNDIKAFFGLSNEDNITRILRILMKKGAPLHLYENYMLPDLAAHISQEDIIKKKAVIRILQEKTGLKIGRGEMYFEAIPADPEVAGILGCQVFDPFVRIQTYLYFPDGKPFEIVNYFMRSELFKFKTEIDTNDFQS
jgi:GntR family transcriptional regulator